MSLFTFQSGDIQIDRIVTTVDIRKAFTFQSGDIQIRSRVIKNKAINDLHSNLVIFKFVKPLLMIC